MDQQEQGVDQRKQLIRRTPEEWELLACKAQLLRSDYTTWIRDNFSWKQHGKDAAVRGYTVWMMEQLEITGTCQPSTFVSSIARALRRMHRGARVRLKNNQEKFKCPKQQT